MAGPGPHVENPQGESKTHHLYLCGRIGVEEDVRGRLWGVAGLLLFLRREGGEGEEEDGQTGLTGNRRRANSQNFNS